MAQIAKVVAITGEVIVVGLDGQTRVLKVGDVIENSETLRTLAGARVELQMADGQVLSIAPEQSVRVDDSLMQTDATPTAQEAAVQAATPAAVLQALQLGADPFAALEAPAAGLTAGGDAGGGSSFVRLLRIVEGVEPLAYEYTLGLPPKPEGRMGTIRAPGTASSFGMMAQLTTSLFWLAVPHRIRFFILTGVTIPL